MTHEYLKKIIFQKIFFLKKSQIIFHKSPKNLLITKKILSAELIQELKNKNITNTGIDKINMPDKEWLINVLFTVNSQNIIFSQNLNNQ